MRNHSGVAYIGSLICVGTVLALTSACNSSSSGDGHSLELELVSANANGDGALGVQAVGTQYAGLGDAGPGGAMDATGDLVIFHGGGKDYNVDYSIEVFVRDMSAEDLAIEHVSISPNGTVHDRSSGSSLRPVLSGDGSTAAFYSSGFSDVESIYPQVFVRDLATGETVLASGYAGSDLPSTEAGSRFPNISDDGSRVVFETSADLINGGMHHDLPGFEGYPTSQIYIRDVVSESTRLISHDGSDSEVAGSHLSRYPDISGNGQYVVFQSGSENIHPDADEEYESVFLYDLEEQAFTLLSVGEQGEPLMVDAEQPRISYDGERVVFRTRYSLYLWERDNGTEIILEEPVANPVISGNGRYVAYQNTVNPRGQIFRLGIEGGGQPMMVSRTQSGNSPNEESEHPVISYDGSVIAFDSKATDMIGGNHDHGTQTDVYRVVISSD